MPKRTALLLCGLMGCATPPLYGLETVPIDGATLDEEEALRAEIDDILQMYDARGVVLTSLEVRDEMPRHKGIGQYRGRHARILIQRNSLGLMRDTLRHEVCHAMDGQYGNLHDGYAAGMMEAYRSLVNADDLYDSSQKQRAEGFAQLCENGSGPLTALASDTDNNHTIRHAADWMIDEVVLAEPEAPSPWAWFQAPRSPSPDITVSENGVLTLAWDAETAHVDWNGNAVEGPGDAPAISSFPDREIVRSEVGFPGNLAIAGRAASGAMVAYGTARGGRRMEAFARQPDGPWAWLGTVNWLYLAEREGELIRVNAVDGTLYVERFR